jgi:Ser/Thr protein kinase RdoA (MazF antagonist)
VKSPAPRLLVTSAGRTVVNLRGKNYCLFEFTGGLNYSWTYLFRPHRMRLMRTGGRTLARLHRQLAEFEPVGRHHLGFVSCLGDRSRDLEWHIRKVAELKERSQELGEPAADWLIARADRFLDDISHLTCKLKEAGLPRTIIHGDFGLHNLIFQDADHATPMDFELARLEWRLSDLVSCISKLRNRKGEYDMRSVAELLAAYQSENPVGDEEWRWFPLVWKHYKLAKAVQYWSSYFETNGPAHKLSLARDAAEQSDWLLQEPGRLDGLRSRMRREA